MYYVGIEISQIATYIPNETIISAGKRRYDKRNKQSQNLVHPFQNVVDMFYNDFLNKANKL